MVARLNYDDLPASVRKRIDAAAAKTAPTPRARAPVTPCEWECRACGARFVHYSKAEKHADEQRHARIEVVIH